MRPDLAGEAACQRVQAGRARQERADLVQVGQALALDLQPRRLLAHLVFQAAVEGLQRLRHLVEAGRKLPELVVAVHHDAGGQIALLHRGEAALEPRQRIEHEQIARVEHGHRAGDGQRQHRELEQVQDRGPAGDLALDGRHQFVDQGHEGGGVAASLRGSGAGGQPVLAQLPPSARSPGRSARARSGTRARTGAATDRRSAAAPGCRRRSAPGPSSRARGRGSTIRTRCGRSACACARPR